VKVLSVFLIPECWKRTSESSDVDDVGINIDVREFIVGIALRKLPKQLWPSVLNSR
jgi:hypothetical protein